jgi:N-methylhydantoinase B
LIANNVRTPVERIGDLQAQINSLNIGHKRMIELSKRYDNTELHFYSNALIDYSAEFMRKTINRIPNGVYQAIDFMEDDGAGNVNVNINVKITINKNNCIVDFTGTHENVAGCVNATKAITASSVLYVFRTLIEQNVAANSGILKPIEIIIPEKSVLNPDFPHAVAGGNVETSQRIVDVLYKALSTALPDIIPAASQGTMNNLTLGSSKQGFAYYETIPGGLGAGPELNGEDAVHSHMTNTLNTPVEAIEIEYPLEVIEYSIRKSSGGKGKHNGGNGIVRKIKAKEKTNGTILSERRKIGPHGLNNGKPGKCGVNYIEKSNGRKITLKSKCEFILEKDDIIVIETPGGGAWGKS